MATMHNGSSASHDELSQIKRKLIWRMVVAGMMIVGLLGGLALFDHLGTQMETESPAPAFSEPVPVPKKNLTQPVTPLEAAPEAKDEKKPENDKAAPEASALPIDNAAPAVEPPPRPEVAAQPVLPRATQPMARLLTRPVTSAGGRSSEMRSGVSTSPAARSEASAPSSATPPAPAPVPARLLSGYALQAGVFSDTRRAEELHARLTLAGIPSSIEARVQVGPFKSKKEAESAREKMKSLGIEAVLLPPRGSTR